MATILSMARQSNASANVRSAETDREAVRYLSQQIRKAMVDRGWVDKKGEPKVSMLRDAITDSGEKELRWQTVQAWIDCDIKKLPRAENVSQLARVLGVTLDDLIGIATGKEPGNAAWHAFLETEEGSSMTERERKLAARYLPDEGEPTVSGYLLHLAAIRTKRHQR